MAAPKRPAAKTKTKAKSKPAAPAKKKAASKPAPKKPAPKPAAKASPRGGVAISPITGQPVREKVHLPIKGYGRLNSFEVVEALYGKTVAQLKQILAYEEKHQGRRMIIDRINDNVRRATTR